MEKASGGGKPAARFGFDFSWADEVEREEREQQLQSVMEQQGREAKKEQHQTRADPFGAARLREVVLAEKGVDWRALDRELDAAATRGHRRVAAWTARAPAASSHARIVLAPPCAPTPARRGRWDRGSGQTPGPRLHDAESTPQPRGAAARGSARGKFQCRRRCGEHGRLAARGGRSSAGSTSATAAAPRSGAPARRPATRAEVKQSECGRGCNW
jgi:hypothetical protein